MLPVEPGHGSEQVALYADKDGDLALPTVEPLTQQDLLNIPMVASWIADETNSNGDWDFELLYCTPKGAVEEQVLRVCEDSKDPGRVLGLSSLLTKHLVSTADHGVGVRACTPAVVSGSPTGRSSRSPSAGNARPKGWLDMLKARWEHAKARPHFHRHAPQPVDNRMLFFVRLPRTPIPLAQSKQ
jgi:hypothetical protein